jgi:hypothetical protein
MSLDNSPFIYEILPDEIELEDDNNEVVQKLMQRYRYKEPEPTLDEVLEKIYEKGISSLSIQEQSVLKQTK